MSNNIDVIEAEAHEECSFPVYIIYSRWSLDQLDTFLKDYGEIGYLRIVYDNNNKETDRTIVILPEEMYESLCDKGFGGGKTGSYTYNKEIKIVPFVMKEGNYPGEGRNRTLFVPVPKVLGSNDTQVIAAVMDKLKHLSEWGIIKPDTYTVNVPLQSREKGGVKSGCFITFRREVSIERIAMVRTLLTDTYWPEQNEKEERSIFRCFWARDRKHYDERKESSAEDSKKLKEEKKKDAIQRTVSSARAVKAEPKKAPTIPVSTQPTLDLE